MPLKLSQSFSFFGGGSSSSYDDKKADASTERGRPPSLRLQMDKEVYRPGDSIVATVEISNGISRGEPPRPDDGSFTFMMDSMSFEIKGIEKRDTQWFATQKPLPGSKEKRGNVLHFPRVDPLWVIVVVVFFSFHSLHAWSVLPFAPLSATGHAATGFGFLGEL